ncbi:MAG: GntR family transcriptional regulator [Chloroflexales bacterium]|nr:GntR family transcriptional regulator [Chloroflexales bacterium]
MGFRPTSAEEIRQTLLSRINRGEYALGSRIPPARTLADEFGANRNTVGKAFQELARDGFVRLVPGRGGGTFVQRAEAAAVVAEAQIRNALRPLIEQARVRGLSKAALSATIQQLVDATFDSQIPRVKFLECNVHDARTLVAQLEPLIGFRMEIGVIDQEDLGALGDQYDLIVTTFHHLAEVTRALTNQRHKVIGVNAVPTAAVALKIALIEARHLGLVCGRENTAQSMKYLVASYHPDDELEVALVDDVEGVRALASRSEALIVTYSCADAVTRLTDRTPDVVVEFQIDNQSIMFLRQQIVGLQALHTVAT